MYYFVVYYNEEILFYGENYGMYYLDSEKSIIKILSVNKSKVCVLFS